MTDDKIVTSRAQEMPHPKSRLICFQDLD